MPCFLLKIWYCILIEHVSETITTLAHASTALQYFHDPTKNKNFPGIKNGNPESPTPYGVLGGS